MARSAFYISAVIIGAHRCVPLFLRQASGWKTGYDMALAMAYYRNRSAFILS